MKTALYIILALCAVSILMGIGLWFIPDMNQTFVGIISSLHIGVGIGFGALAIDEFKEDK